MSAAAGSAKQAMTRAYRAPLFTQRVVLSDGSTYTKLTTSPRSSLRLTKDIRNTPLYNPDASRSLNQEENKRLSKFKGRFAGFGGDEEGAAEGDMDWMVSAEARAAPKASAREIKESGNRKSKAKK